MIILKDVCKTYKSKSISFQALTNINLRIEEGEFVAIMGPSGSGKSTLMNILGCLDRFDSGSYILKGKDVSNLNDDDLAYTRNKELGFVFQNFNLLPRMNILENVELPMIYAKVGERDRRSNALASLERVGLINWIKHKPNEISGGQKQRVAIARALVNNPSVIIADEPTGNLDSKVSLEVMDIFKSLNNDGTTIIMVTHEEDIAEHSRRIVKVLDGRIYEV